MLCLQETKRLLIKEQLMKTAASPLPSVAMRAKAFAGSRDNLDKVPMTHIIFRG